MATYDDGEYEVQPGIDFVRLVRDNAGSYLVISAVIGALTAAGALAVLALPPIDRSVSLDITLTFEGAQADRYPNGAPFSPNDVISGSVVEAVWSAQGLQSSVPLDQLVRNLQAVEGGSEVDLIRSEFVQKLSNAKLTAAERSALERDFRARLDAATAAALRLSASCEGTGVAPEQLERLLLALPAEWARAQDAAGVNAPDYPVPSASVLRNAADRLSAGQPGASPLFVLENARDSLETLGSTVSLVSKLSGGRSIRDSKGASIVDLNQEIEAIRRNEVLPAYVQALSATKVANPAGFRAVRSARAAVLDAKLANATEIARVWHSMLAEFSSEARPRALSQPGSPAATSVQEVQASLDSSFIDRVIDQAVKSQDLEYRRELMEQAADADLELARIGSEQRLERWLDSEVEALSASGSPLKASDVAPVAELARRVAALSDRLAEIVGAMRARNLNPASSMYRVVAPPRLREVRPYEPKTLIVVGGVAWLAALGLSTVAFAVRARRFAGQHLLLGERQSPPEHHVAGAVAGLQDRRETDPRRISQAPREPVA